MSALLAASLDGAILGTGIRNLRASQNQRNNSQISYDTTEGAGNASCNQIQADRKVGSAIL